MNVLAARWIAGTPPLTEQAADLDRVWTLFFSIAVGIVVLITALLIWIMVRYRAGRRPELPPQRREHIPLEVAYTVVPLALVVGLFVVTIGSIHSIERTDTEPDVVVDVTAFQWQWQFDYTELDARSVTSGDANPELVLPAGATVTFVLTSLDVVHSFWIPGFRFKRDIFPGETTTFQVDVGGTTGSFPNTGVCAEFCGIDHHKMKFDVLIVDPNDFDAWIADHRTVDLGTESTEGTP